MTSLKENVRSKQYFAIVLRLSPTSISAGLAGTATPIVIESVSPVIEVDTTRSPDTLQPDGTYVFYCNDKLRLDDDNQVLRIWRARLHEIFYEKLQINPRQTKIFVVEPVLFSNHLKTLLSQRLLYQHFQVASVVFLSETLMSCMSSGIKSGLIIDIGWEETTVVPVYDLHVLNGIIGITERGERWLYQETVKQIGEQNICTLEDDDKRAMFAKIRHTITNYFYVTEAFSEIPIRADEEKLFHIDDNISVPNSKRHSLVEDFLLAEDSSTDVNTRPLVSVITKDVIPKLPRDSSKEILSNIIITGDGINKIAGLRGRLASEIAKEIPKSTNVRVCKNLGSWAGASLYCDNILTRSTTLLKQFGEVKKEVS